MCIYIETFVALVTIKTELSCVQLHASIQISFPSILFVTLGAGKLVPIICLLNTFSYPLKLHAEIKHCSCAFRKNKHIFLIDFLIAQLLALVSPKEHEVNFMCPWL